MNYRQLAFLFLCIPIRLLIAFLAYSISLQYLPLLAIVLGTISITTLTLFFTKSRLNAPEGGGVTWWKDLRLLHGMLFLTATIYALLKNKYVFIPLLMDPIIGLFAFIHHYYQ